MCAEGLHFSAFHWRGDAAGSSQGAQCLGSAYQIVGKYSLCCLTHNRSTQMKYNSKESVLRGWSKQVNAHRWESQDYNGEKIHGEIDGHSCSFAHLRCATNNTAATVLGAFKTVVEQFSLPQWVKSY